jgi:hypothetical protein
MRKGRSLKSIRCRELLHILAINSKLKDIYELRVKYTINKT